jgi:hypothetical protein
MRQPARGRLSIAVEAVNQKKARLRESQPIRYEARGRQPMRGSSADIGQYNRISSSDFFGRAMVSDRFEFPFFKGLILFFWLYLLIFV